MPSAGEVPAVGGVKIVYVNLDTLLEDTSISGAEKNVGKSKFSC